jgi:hypothetical protein
MENFYAYVHWRPRASQNYRCLKSLTLVLLALCILFICLVKFIILHHLSVVTFLVECGFNRDR